MQVDYNTKFSIIIPTYCSGKTLSKCLQSVVNQSNSNYEVWLIDGISTDNTIDIIKHYQQLNPAINYISEKDKGIYDAMNKGIDLVKGEWVYFLGSDDTLYDENVLMAIAEKISQTDAEVIYGNVLMHGHNQWNLDNVIFDGEYNTEKLIDRNINHQAIFYKKTVFQKNGKFNLSYITSADFDFNMRCYANTKFSYIDLIIADFNLGGHSTHVEDKEFYKDRGALMVKYFGPKIYSKQFINARLYLQQAALSSASPLGLYHRLYCVLACIKLKIHSLLIAA